MERPGNELGHRDFIPSARKLDGGIRGQGDRILAAEKLHLRESENYERSGINIEKAYKISI